MTRDYGPGVYQWMEIAGGRAQIPDEFQRMIAAWEVLVGWHRANDERDTTDARLKAKLKDELPGLNMDQVDGWPRALKTLRDLAPVEKMRGASQTGELWGIASLTDWGQIVEMLYGVRCNLVKGGKNPNDPRDLTVAAAAAEASRLIAGALLRR